MPLARGKAHLQTQLCPATEPVDNDLPHVCHISLAQLRPGARTAKEQTLRWRQSRDWVGWGLGQALWHYPKAPVSVVLSVGRVAVLWLHSFLFWTSFATL